MSLRFCVLGMALVLMAMSSVAANDERLAIGEVAHRLVAPSDEDGDARISVKVPVRNLSTDELIVCVDMQSRDVGGFAVFETSVSATIAPGAQEILSDWQYLQESAFLTIDSWGVRAVHAFPVEKHEEQPVTCGEVEQKIVEPVDKDSEIRYSVKVPVKNLTATDQVVTLHLTAIDREGFVMDTVTLKGNVDVGGRREFTESGFLFVDAYESIVEWKVEVEGGRSSN